MAASDSPEIEARAADRVVVFSDAVVAIAITLLALDLPIPDLTGNPSNLDVLHSLRHNWTSYFAFLISFFTCYGTTRPSRPGTRTIWPGTPRSASS